jgi:hypothetical protein
MAYEAPLMKKKSFIKTGEPTISSYDWTDLVSQQGYCLFQGSRTIAESVGLPGGKTEKLIMVGRAMAGAEPRVAVNPLGGVSIAKGATREITLPTGPIETFTFQTPHIIEGPMFISLHWGIRRRNTDSGGSSDAAIEIEVLKNDSVIASGQGSERDVKTATTVQRFKENLFIDIPRTNLSIGDKIKLKVYVRNLDDTNAIAGTPLIAFAIDSLGQEAKADEGGTREIVFEDTTEFNVLIPFKIDL